jgi:hypothetical protein
MLYAYQTFFGRLTQHHFGVIILHFCVNLVSLFGNNRSSKPLLTTLVSTLFSSFMNLSNKFHGSDRGEDQTGTWLTILDSNINNYRNEENKYWLQRLK